MLASRVEQAPHGVRPQRLRRRALIASPAGIAVWQVVLTAVFTTVDGAPLETLAQVT